MEFGDWGWIDGWMDSAVWFGLGFGGNEMMT
jgi:hypothetical protein